MRWIREYIARIKGRKDDVATYLKRIERLALKKNVKIHHMQILSYAAHLREARNIHGKRGIENIYQKIISYILVHNKTPDANQVKKWVDKLNKRQT